ncbi:hypothetical protein AB0F68_06960, partial [Micromonospora sp. NPDC023966]|uniref:hypothetical protein n=1 Tax=Micromonospora sp. NPDC023966 TaxID=3154699 RepID=UPI003405D02E
MSTHVTTINGPYTAVFAASVVPLPMARQDPRAVFADAGLERFTGRRWLLEEVDLFIEKHPCGYIWVEAEAGLGKTAFAAWLVSTRDYISHFTRYSNGGVTSVAIRNLSAQLIATYELLDLAPGDFVPAWAETPEGFTALLAEAATRAEAAGSPLVLVVDGLDESERVPGVLPLGLPRLLPAGVYVVATYRTGSPPGRTDSPATVLRIDTLDSRNLNDLSEYLAVAATDDVLAARLDDHDMTPETFVETLAQRCGGVWIYLRYVLSELQLGLRALDDLGDLPAGLQDYYGRHIQAWRDLPDFYEVRLPVLATLGALGEPMTVDVIAELSGVADPRAVQRLCDLEFRPFLTASSEFPRRFAIYHASLRDFLAGRLTASRLGVHPDDRKALAELLREVTLAAHCRIADCYLGAWGGLAEGLPQLGADPVLVQRHGGYPVRHLARHLELAGRLNDLHRLMTAELSETPAVPANAWYLVHDRTHSIDRYLDDLGRATRCAEAATDAAIAEHRPATSLGREIRYALLSASIHSLTDTIPPAMLPALVASRIWEPNRAVAHARRYTNLETRCSALVALRAVVPPDARDALLAEALAAAEAVPAETARVWLASGLVPYLDGAQTSALIAAIPATTSEHLRPGVLARLADQTTVESQLRSLFAQAVVITNEQIRASALVALAPYLSPTLLDDALARAAEIRAEDVKALAFVSLAAHLDAAQLARLHPYASAIEDRDCHAFALAGIAACAGVGDRPDHVADALTAAQAFVSERMRGSAIAALAPHLDRRQFERAMPAVRRLASLDARTLALVSLAPHTPLDLLPEALADARGFADEDARADVLVALAPHLPVHLLTEVLANVRSISNEDARADVLAALAPHLPVHLLTEVLANVRSISNEDARADVLAALASHLPNHLLLEALSDARAIADQDGGAAVVAALAVELSNTATRTQAVADALNASRVMQSDHDRASVLARLAQWLSDDLLEEAVSITSTFADDDARAKVLVALASHLPDRLMADGLAIALSLITEEPRTRAMAALGPLLAPDHLAVGVAAAEEIPEEIGRVQALAALVPFLSDDTRDEVLAT